MQHHNGNAKLTPQRVREMRQLRSEGWSYPKLAREFGVGENQVAKICKGTAWAHVTQGEEILTNGEAQLRQLTMPGPSQEEIEASKARFLKLMAQESEEESSIPPQYRRADNWEQAVKDLVQTANERRAESGPPPEPVKVRYPTRHNPLGAEDGGAEKAEQLLETLKDEHTDSQAHDGDSEKGSSVE